jgi:hypothetical protein
MAVGCQHGQHHAAATRIHNLRGKHICDCSRVDGRGAGTAYTAELERTGLYLVYVRGVESTCQTHGSNIIQKHSNMIGINASLRFANERQVEHVKRQ